MRLLWIILLQLIWLLTNSTFTLINSLRTTTSWILFRFFILSLFITGDVHCNIVVRWILAYILQLQALLELISVRTGVIRTGLRWLRKTSPYQLSVSIKLCIDLQITSSVDLLWWKSIILSIWSDLFLIFFVFTIFLIALISARIAMTTSFCFQRYLLIILFPIQQWTSSLKSLVTQILLVIWFSELDYLHFGLLFP